MLIVKMSSQLVVVDAPEGTFLILDESSIPIRTVVTNANKEVAETRSSRGLI